MRAEGKGGKEMITIIYNDYTMRQLPGSSLTIVENNKTKNKKFVVGIPLTKENAQKIIIASGK
jgi:hypothetical protein